VRRLWVQILHTSGARIYALLAGLVVLSVTARYLGPPGRGVVVAATGWVALFATFGGLSLGQVAVYRAVGRPPAVWLSATLGTLLSCLAAATIIGWVIVLTAYVLSGGAFFHHLTGVVLTLAFLTLPTLIWAEYATSLLMALDVLRIANIAQVLSSTVNALIVVVLLRMTTLGVYAPLVAAAAAAGIASAVTLGSVLKRSGRPCLVADSTREMLTGGIKLHANAVGTFFFTQASLLIVNQYRAPSETAFYALALQLIMVAQIVPNAVGMVAYTLVGQQGPDAAWPVQRRLLMQALGIAVAAIIAGYLFAPVAIRLVAGRDFLPAVVPFRVMLPSLLGMTVSAVMASQWIGRGFFGRAAVITLVAGFVNVAATYVLVPRFGLLGACWATVGVYGLTVVVNGIMAVWVQRRAMSLVATDSALAVEGT